MASAKEYAYYVRGNKIAIVQKDHTGNVDGLYNAGTSVDLPVGGGVWKSPLAAVTNGLQVEYTYEGGWEYITSNKHTLYSELDDNGVLKFQTASAHGNLTSTYTAGKKFLVRNSEKFSGIHEVASSSHGSYTAITTKTKTRAKAVDGVYAETNVVSYYDIDALDDEESIIPVNSYQGLALVYYVKARMAEDQKDFKQRDYFMAQFHKMVEQDNSSKISGSRNISPGLNAIR